METVLYDAATDYIKIFITLSLKRTINPVWGPWLVFAASNICQEG